MANQCHDLFPFGESKRNRQCLFMVTCCGTFQMYLPLARRGTPYLHRHIEISWCLLSSSETKTNNKRFQYARTSLAHLDLWRPHASQYRQRHSLFLLPTKKGFCLCMEKISNALSIFPCSSNKGRRLRLR